MALRFDKSPIGSVERTPSGSLRVPATPTRSGVFTYLDASGKAVREWRPPEEVLRADSLASLEDAIVTIGHPPRGVSPANAGSLNVGHVRAGSVRGDDKRAIVSSTFVLTRADAIDGALKRELVETSCGYDARIDETPGVVPDGMPDAGKPYDRIQRDIVYNHVAILKRGDGRLGHECRMRLDSSGAQILDAGEPGDPDEDEEESDESDPKMKTKIKKADGKEVELSYAEAVTVLTAERDAEKARADAASAELAKRDADAAKARRDALEKRCKSVLGAEFKCDGVSDRDLMVAVIKRTDSAFDPADKADTYIQVRFDMAPAGGAAAVAAALNGGVTPETARADGSGEPSEAQKKAAELQKKADSAWQLKA